MRNKIDGQILTKSSLQRFHEPDDKTCPLGDMLQHVGNLNKDISDILTCAKRLIIIDMRDLYSVSTNYLEGGEGGEWCMAKRKDIEKKMNQPHSSPHYDN